MPAPTYVIRHAVNAVVGWVGIVFCARTAERLFGWHTGLLTLLMLALAPRYFGDAMNNPKDIPFAAASAVVLYCLASAGSRYPYLSWNRTAQLAAAIGLAINVRVGGLLFIGYAAVLLGALVLNDGRPFARRAALTGVRVVAIAVASLLLGTVFWPWAQAQPLTPAVRSAGAHDQFRLGWKRPLSGRIDSRDAAALALSVCLPGNRDASCGLVGLVLSVAVPARNGWKRTGLWFALLFPLLYVVARHSTLYDGIRHLLFVYIPMFVLAGEGWRAALARIRPPRLRLTAFALLAIGLLEPLVFQLRNHPNQIVYFNALVGGPAGAAGRFDLDYWANSELQAIRWIDRRAKSAPERLIVTGAPPSVIRGNIDRFQSMEFRANLHRPHHLIVMPTRSATSEQLQRMTTEARVLHVIRTADGAPLCIVSRGPLYERVKHLFENAGPAS